MNLVDEISRSWGWTGLKAVEVVGENDFGNLMVKDVNGAYWRLCPEDCYCKLVASSRAELDVLSTDQSFLRDWYMRELVEYAQTKCGPLSEGRKYCLKIPGLLGGEYGGENIATAPLVEIIRMSGHIAKQTKRLARRFRRQTNGDRPMTHNPALNRTAQQRRCAPLLGSLRASRSGCRLAPRWAACSADHD